jgi:glycosyltransferase involved in cell wall biosynthesis
VNAQASPDVSVVIPVYNEEEGLPFLFERLYPALDALGRTYEVVFVDDGSRDRSVAVLREQFQRRPDVTRVVVLARNAGQHLAILAAFQQTRGRYVITLDADRRRLRRHGPRQPPGRAVAQGGVALSQSLARRHHLDPYHRPGLHAARL